MFISLKSVGWKALLLLLILALAGCSSSMKTEYQRPRVTLPEQWMAASDRGNLVLQGPGWWKVFQDPVLDQLIDKVLKTNNELAAAAIKVRKARLEAGLEAESLRPEWSVSASVGKTKDLRSGTSSNSSGTTTRLSWEPDFWGKLASSRDAADWEARATEQDLAYTALSLVGTTADLYWRIAYLNQSIQTSRESIEYTFKTLEMVRVKYTAGEVSELDVLQAEQNVETQKGDLESLYQEMAEARNSLAILFDQPPGPIVADPKHLTDMAVPIPKPGMPAAILGNRPDLRAAELRLRKVLASTDSTRANYYPSLSLTSQIGTSSTQLLNLLANPVATLGAGLSLPFVQWNKMKLNIEIAKEEYEQAVVEFRQTLYEALQDVENALSAGKHYMAREAILLRSLDLAREAERMAEVRYRAGQTGVQDWLDQQETRRTAELALAKNRYNRLNNLMTLYVALGGEPVSKDAE